MDETTELETMTELLEPALEPSLEEIDAYLERVQAMEPTEPPCPLVLVEQAPSADVEEALAVDGRGNPKNTIDNALTVLRLDPALAERLALDTMSGDIVVRGALPWAASPSERLWDDRIDLPALTAYIERMYGFGNKEKVADAVMLAAHEHKFDALVRMLDSLPAWDGAERVGHMMHWFLGAADDEYTTAVERVLYAGLMARALQPGCKFDSMVVFTGAQGIGKSTFARRLACADAYFSDDLKAISAGDKAAQECLQNKWVVEVAELSATRASDEASVKAFVTRQVDTYREPYAKRAMDHPRRCVLLGTSNPSTFLSDPTGNRRFLPVACSLERAKYDVTDDSCVYYFAQAAREALDLYKAGELPTVLPDSVLGEARKKQEEATLERPAEGLIEAYLSTLLPGARVCTAQLAEMALDIPRAAQKRYQLAEISAYLDRLPFLRRELSKKRCGAWGVQRCWTLVARPPEESPTEESEAA